MPPDLLNTTQAAEILGLHPDSVSRLARQGEIEFVLSPRGYRFKRSVIRAYKAHVRGPGNPYGWEISNETMLDEKWKE